MEHKELAIRLLEIKENTNNYEEYIRESKSTFPNVPEVIIDIVWCVFDIITNAVVV